MARKHPSGNDWKLEKYKKRPKMGKKQTCPRGSKAGRSLLKRSDRVQRTARTEGSTMSGNQNGKPGPNARKELTRGIPRQVRDPPQCPNCLANKQFGHCGGSLTCLGIPLVNSFRAFGPGFPFWFPDIIDPSVLAVR